MLTGQQLIGGEEVSAGGATFRAIAPADGSSLEPAFCEGGERDVALAAESAEEAFRAMRAIDHGRRAGFLEAIADGLLAVGAPLLDRAHLETGLPVARLEGERLRTVNQFRMFAELLRDGSWCECTVDRAIPDRSPIPKPELRSMQVPLGPVAVFGASNFPLAFSVPGGDTASALAAGCPVVVKGHPAHPGTSELAARVIVEAARACQMPAGVFNLVQGSGHDVGQALVTHPLIKAVAFTGSLHGGRALFNLAAARPEPIPVYAEMGSINPLFLLPGALQQGSEGIADGFVAALTLGVGQFCTNPGMVVAIAGPELDEFIDQVLEKLSQVPSGLMLHAGIRDNYLDQVRRVAATPGVENLLVPPADIAGRCEAQPALFRVSAGDWLSTTRLADEVFGPAAIVVTCPDEESMTTVAHHLRGQLTVSVHASTTGPDQDHVYRLLPLLERRAGRLVFNGFPTGVEVCPSMVHGGPYPASSDNRSTSVGTAAIRRFLRPVCYQNFPMNLLPAELADQG